MIKSDLGRRFVSLLSIDIFLKAVGFLLLPVYLKLMTTEEFGIFNYAFSLAMGLSFVMGTGQHIIISRFYHNNEYSRQTIKETILLGVLVLTILYAVIGVFYKDVFSGLLFKTDISNWLYYGVLYLAIVQSLNQILMTYLYQSENIRGVKYKSSFDLLFSHGLALSLLLALNELKPEIRIYSIAAGFTFTISYYFWRKFSLDSFLFKGFSKSLFQRGLKNGIPVAIGSVSNIFINLGDRYNIEKLLDNNQLGIYSLGIAICNVMLVFFNSFQGAWWPVVFKEENLKVTFKRIHKIFLILLGGSLLFGLAAYPAIHIFTKFGVDLRYLKTLDFLWVLVVSVFFQICSMLVGSIYEIFEKTYISVVINIIFSGANLLLNSLLIGIYGLAGAAYATVLISLGLFCLNYLVVTILLKTSKPNGRYRYE
jgi:O-antigen/teichoic acid export membrane protein